MAVSITTVLNLTHYLVQVPNFAMDSTDAIPPSADPSERMYVVHPFGPLKPFEISRLRLATPSSPSSPSESNSHWHANWPPQLLFDVVYGATVLHEFGVPATKARVGQLWEELYYPRGGFDATTAEMDCERRRARKERAEAREPPRPDGFDLLMMIPYLGVPEEELQAYFAEGARRAEEEERRGVEAKVNGWREDVVSRM